MLGREHEADLEREARKWRRAAEVRGRPRADARRVAAFLALALLGVLVFAAVARAYDTPSALNDVAHVYSLGAGEVRCSSEAEWKADFAASFGWAYTNLRDDYSVLAPTVCEAALNVGNESVPAWQQALGVWVLVHESFHLRHWRFRRNEGKVACQAIVYFTDAAQRLGASTEQATELYPYALAFHLRQTRLFPAYRDPGCHVPLWVPPVEP
jgi:hypothetical protein